MSVGVPLNFYTAKDVGTTQRLPSTSLLAIDSEDRFKDIAEARLGDVDFGAPISKLDPYSFLITKNESIMNGFFTRLGLTEVVLPWVIPNINPKTSDIRVLYDISGGVSGEVFVSLLFGFYRPAELATAMQTAVRSALIPIDANYSAFTMSYGDDGTPGFVYDTNIPNLGIGFAPMTTSLAGGALAPGYYPYDANKTRQLFDVLGMTRVNSLTRDISGNVITFADGGQTFCQACTYVDVVCTQLTANQALKDTMSQEVARDVLCRIYITGNDVNNVPASSANFCPPGCAPFTVYRNFSQPKQIQWLPNQPVQSSLRFDLFDDMGNLLGESDPLVNTGAEFAGQRTASYNRTNWSFSILVSEN